MTCFCKTFISSLTRELCCNKNLLCKWRHYPTVTTLPDLTVPWCRSTLSPFGPSVVFFTLKVNTVILVVITKKLRDLDKAKAPFQTISVGNLAVGSAVYRYRTVGGYAAEVHVENHHNQSSVLWSVQLIYWSGSCTVLFFSDFQDARKIRLFKKNFFCLLPYSRYIDISLWSHNTGTVEIKFFVNKVSTDRGYRYLHTFSRIRITMTRIRFQLFSHAHLDPTFHLMRIWVRIRPSLRCGFRNSTAASVETKRTSY